MKKFEIVQREDPRVAAATALVKLIASELKPPAGVPDKSVKQMCMQQSVCMVFDAIFEWGKLNGVSADDSMSAAGYGLGAFLFASMHGQEGLAVRCLVDGIHNYIEDASHFLKPQGSV